MRSIRRRTFMEYVGAAALGAVLHQAEEHAGPPDEVNLKDGWLIQSSTLVDKGGEAISRTGFATRGWYRTSVPSTVLSALVKNGVYPDPRIGLNAYRIPDSSEEFNRKYDLSKYSHLPDRGNPWTDPYWYHTEFTLPSAEPDQHGWLNFNCINYRAEVWLNGVKIAGKDRMVGMFQRFRFDITPHLKPGRNALAVKIFPVEHPGEPDKQVEVFGRPRDYQKEIRRDVTELFTIGYDCMMTVPDRNMGICQNVFIRWTGPVALRNPFIVTDLSLPDTSRATLAVSVELTNASQRTVQGLLCGQVAGTEILFEQALKLGPNETKLVSVDPKPVMANPRLWWPVNYGEQHLYDLVLQFKADGVVSDEQKVAFGVRKVTTEMHELEGWHGRRVLVNGRKIFCRGGYIQPELLLDWDAQRFETEIRYYADANMNLIYFEDIPNPPDEFLDECDRRGVLSGSCFYGCSSLCPGPDYQPSHGEQTSCHAPRNYPDDFALLESCTIDLLKRYRNHPSLVMYMAMNEGDTREQVYQMWRRYINELDGTRFWIPSGYFPDSRKNVPDWFKQDVPVGMNDLGNKSYTWKEPATYFQWVRTDRSWMFKIESGSASLPPISTLAKFLPDLGAHSTNGAPFPLTETWAHHGANSYYKDYDTAIRRLHGEPESVADYCWKGHLLTADQHRAFFEAVNHRMWAITSGFTEWKINSCYPDVQWQNFDYYFKPGVSHFYIKNSCRPLHVQMDLIDYTVSVINNHLRPHSGLEVSAHVSDLNAKLLWQHNAKVEMPGNTYREIFTIPNLTNLAPFVFVRLELKDPSGRLVSDNFYWLRCQGTADYKALHQLPLVKLDTTSKMEDHGGEKLMHVRVANPTGRIAFFIQLALTKGAGGGEILPMFWDDNYFSLLPGERRELTGRVATRDLGGKEPVLEVGGWNIQADYRCTDVKPSKTRVKADELFSLTAFIVDTFLDGSRVSLLVDGQTAQSKWAWARDTKTDEVLFKLSLSKPGLHRLAVGKSETQVTVV